MFIVHTPDWLHIIKNASFYVEIPSMEKDDVEKMKERAERNKLFIYIKEFNKLTTHIYK